MSNTIKLKRGSGSDPSASDLAVGELAIRTDSGKIFTKKDNGSVAEISGGGGISDGDKGDITVSNGGDTFTIDNDAITQAKIADDAVGTDQIASGSITSARIADGAIVNADINASAAIAGTKISPDFGSQDITTTGSLNTQGTHIIGGTFPQIFLQDSNDNPDFRLQNSNGKFIVKDDTNDAIRLRVNSDGHVDVLGNLDVGAGLDVTGNISCSGTVDGVDIAARNTLFGGLTSSSGVLTNGVTATTQSAGDNSTKVATTAYADTAVSNLVDSAPSALNTLNELAAALGDDANFSTTVTNSIATKMPLAGGTFSGNVSFGDNNITNVGTIALDTIKGDADDNTNINFAGSDVINIKPAGTTRLAINTSGITVTGAIAVSSTVDGRDLATDGTKLDGIESGATADQTASEILTAIKTVDGASSGLDADTLDGVEGSNYAQKTGATCSGDFTFQGGAGAVTIAADSDIRLTSGDWTGNAYGKIQHHSNRLYISGGSNSNPALIFRDNASDRIYMKSDGTFYPATDSAIDLGVSNYRWANGYFDTLYGAGSNITALNASNISSGTVNTARLPITYTKADHVTVQSTGAGHDVKLDAADHILLEAGEEEDGSIYFRGNSGVDSYRFSKGGQTSIEGFLSFESLTSDRTFTFPNSAGTIALTSDIPTNNNQLSNGAGYVTSNTQLSNEQVQDIVGGMVSGNSESGITVTYQDSDGTLDFSVSSSGISEDTGSWTPTVTFGGGSSGQSYSIRVGRYVKLGSLVHIQCHVEFSDKGSSSGTAKIAGLPFTIRNGTNDFPSAVMAFKDHGSSSSGPGSISSFMVFGDPNNTTLDIAREQLNDSTSEMNDATNGNFADNTQFMLTMTYVAA